MDAAFAALRGPLGESRTCFGCGKPGHLKKDCFAQNRTKAKAPGICPWCHKGRHFPNQCHSRYDFEGHLIQGNRSQRAARQHALTQMPQPTQQPLQQVPQQGSPQVFT
ncbi:GAK5 protein, partial [Horornis vulcanius]|nr:GAK5 protein [Horornis vulcanius]NXU65741.1 GAK5 protein [Horornis vulcanius]